MRKQFFVAILTNLYQNFKYCLNANRQFDFGTLLNHKYALDFIILQQLKITNRIWNVVSIIYIWYIPVWSSGLYDGRNEQNREKKYANKA